MGTPLVMGMSGAVICGLPLDSQEMVVWATRTGLNYGNYLDCWGAFQIIKYINIYIIIYNSKRDSSILVM